MLSCCGINSEKVATIKMSFISISISIFRELNLKGKRGVGEKSNEDRNLSVSSSYPVIMEVEQSQWASLPYELLLEIIGRVEANEITWPGRRAVLSCAAVCKSWREIAREVVHTPEECGLLTFPMSLKQVSLLTYIIPSVGSFFPFTNMK